MVRRSWVGNIGTYLVALLLVVVSLAPMVWLVNISFERASDIVMGVPTFFLHPTLENYSDAFSGNSFHLSFLSVFVNSVIITVVSVVVAVALAALCAYAISRLRPRGAGGINFLILAVRMVPPIALVLPLYMIYYRLGLLDTRIGMIVPFVALNIPLATWLLEGFFLDIPKNLEDAALIDGCSPFSAFLRVILPLTAPGVAAASVFSFILSWNDLTIPLPLTTTRAPTLPVLASEVVTDQGILWGQLGAISVVMIVPILLFAIFASKYLVIGLASGSVKG